MTGRREKKIKKEKTQESRNKAGFREKERETFNQNRRVRRSDSEARQHEMELDNESRRVRRSNPVYSENERERDSVGRSSWSKAVKQYENNILDGPFHRCFSCDKLWFKRQIFGTTREKLLNKGCDNEFINSVLLQEFRLDDELFFVEPVSIILENENIPDLILISQIYSLSIFHKSFMN